MQRAESGRGITMRVLMVVALLGGMAAGAGSQAASAEKPGMAARAGSQTASAENPRQAEAGQSEQKAAGDTAKGKGNPTPSHARKMSRGLGTGHKARPASVAIESSGVEERYIRAHMEFLASDAMRGRGSMTHDELVAATYIAAELREYGIEPAGDKAKESEGGSNKTGEGASATTGAGRMHYGVSYIQAVPLKQRAFAEPPQLYAGAEGAAKSVGQHGKDMWVLAMPRAEVGGPLQKIEGEGKVTAGAMVLLKSPKGDPRGAAMGALQQGAAAVLVPLKDAMKQARQYNAKVPELPMGDGEGGGPTVIALSPEAMAALDGLADGTMVRVAGKVKDADNAYTWNVVGILHGTDADADKNAIVLTAHLDHLGVGRPVNGDDIFNGADDDASGVTAVLELARHLGASPPPKRTVIFTFFGSEEKGGQGNSYWLAHPPVPIASMAANLEFEMIGRPDSAVAAKTLWLTGYDRSNLGAELAAHGARLVADPHPKEQFFQRSDNYALARKGVVAHTVSSFGLHAQYHRPDDDLAHVDFAHMTEAIRSMVRPVEWLANSDFKPQWAAGKKP